MDHSLPTGVKVYTKRGNGESHVYRTNNCSGNLLRKVVHYFCMAHRSQYLQVNISDTGSG
jgi:hypothetical protein